MKLSRFILMLFIVSILALTACSSNDDAKQEQENTDEQSSEEQGIEVDKGLFNVEITLPSSFFGEEELANIEKNIKEDISDAEITKNDDGSLTIKMSKSEHKQLLNDMKQGFVEGIDQMINEEFTTIQDVTYDEDFSNFKLIVSDQSSFEESFDGFATFSLGLASLMYQAFAGADLEKVKVNFELVDQSTNETFHELVFPDALEELDDLE